MCIRDSLRHGDAEPLGHGADGDVFAPPDGAQLVPKRLGSCLLYTSDAADERSSVDLGGRRIIKKKKDRENSSRSMK